MDIAYALAVIGLLAFIISRRKHRLAKLLLTPALVPAAFVLWVHVITPIVPAEWIVFQQQVDTVSKLVARSYSVLTDPAEKDQLINDFKSIVEIDENGERTVDPELAEKYGDIDIPGPLGEKLDEAKANIDQRNGVRAEHMSSLGQ